MRRTVYHKVLHILQALEEHASYLRSFVGTASLEDVSSFLRPLDRCKDLVDACRQNSGVGTVFAAVYHAYHASYAACSVPANAAHFREFCMSVLAALSLAGVLTMLVSPKFLS
jgi:hypothetical protein